MFATKMEWMRTSTKPIASCFLVNIYNTLNLLHAFSQLTFVKKHRKMAFLPTFTNEEIKAVAEFVKTSSWAHIPFFLFYL